MPELAEVEYYRRRWNPGIGDKIARVRLREGLALSRTLETQKAMSASPSRSFEIESCHWRADHSVVR